MTRARLGSWLAAAAMLPGCYSGLTQRAESGATGDTDPANAESGNAETEGGDSSGPGPDGPVSSCGDEPLSVAPRSMRRLTPLQYRNTMRDLLGWADFEPEYRDIEPIPTQLGVRQLRDDAETAITNIEQWSPQLVPCDIHGGEDATCPSAVIDGFAPLAFRRPLTDGERARLMTTYEDVREQGDFGSGMEALLGAILQAPAMVYQVETGTPVEGRDGLVQLDDHALASRLSYFLWDSMPDAVLFDAAAAGELSTPDGLRAQVERMALDEKAELKMQAFVYHWLGLDGGEAHFALGEQTKDPTYFPEFSDALVDAMQTELEAFVRRVLFEGDGNFDTLLTSRAAYVNGALADLYGVPQGPMEDDAWDWVELDPTQRSGLLTRAAFLSTYASPTVQSPIRRGVYVFENVLCLHLGSPPPDVDDSPIEGGDQDGEVLSVREDVEARTSAPECSGCHAIINNIGFSFEHYDAIGHWRAEEVTSGKSIDASGNVVGTDLDGPVANAVELSDRLRDSDMAKGCFAELWFEQAVGGRPGDEDDCSMSQIEDTFVADGDVREMLVAIALSDSFRFINTNEGDE